MISEGLSCPPMDLTERVYIVAEDDDLPVTLQLMRVDGILRPEFLPRPSASSASSSRHAVTVYDEQGFYLAEDVVIDQYEYIVDETGEIFRQIDTYPNRIPSLDRLPSINSASSTKSLMSEDVREPNMGSSLKTDSSQMSTFSVDGSCTYLQPNSQECDKTELATASVQVIESLNDVITNCCGSHSIDDSAFPVSSVMLSVEGDQNMDNGSVLCEKNALPVYVNSSPSSSGLHTGVCSVPSSPETFSHGASESISAASHDLTSASCVSTNLQNPENWTTEVTDSTDVDMAVVSCVAHNTSLSSIASSDTVCNSTVQLLQPCMSFSTNLCSLVASHEDSCLCWQSVESVDHLESSTVSSSCVLAANSIVTSVAGVLSFADNNSEAVAALCVPVSQSNTPVTDYVVNHTSDSSEHRLTDVLYPLADNCDSSDHNISSHSPIAEFDSRGTEQHLSEIIPTAGISSISQSGVLISAVTTNVLDQSDTNQCCEVETTLGCTDVGSVNVEEAQRNVSESETPSSYNISGALNNSNVDCSLPTSDGDITASFVTTMHKCTNELAVDAESLERNVSETEMASDSGISGVLIPNSSNIDYSVPTSCCDVTVSDVETIRDCIDVLLVGVESNISETEIPSSCSISGAPISNNINVDYSPPISDSDVTASDAKTIRECIGVLPVDAERADQNISQTEVPSSHSILGSPNSSNINCSPPTSECGVIASDIATIRACTNELPFDAKTAEQNISQTEMPSSHSILGSPNSSNVNCSMPTSDCDLTASVVETVRECTNSDLTASVVETVRECTNVIPVDAERAEQNVSETETPSNYGISGYLISSSVDGSTPTSNNCDITAPDVETVLNSPDVLPVDAERNVPQTEIPPCCIVSGAPNSSNVHCSLPTSDCDVTMTNEVTEQKNDMESPTNKENANDLDASLSSALDTVHTAATEALTALEPSISTVTVGLAMQADVQKLSDTNYAANYTYNGCQRDLLETVTHHSNSIHELRQRLRDLHATRRRLRKLRQNETTVLANNAGRLDLDTLSDSDCKRLRLEAIEQELSGRELLLHHREEDLARRILKVEQREKIIRVHEQRLTSCPSSPSWENPGIMQSSPCQEKPNIVPPDSLLQSFPNLKSVDRQSDIIDDKCGVTRKRTVHRRRPHLLPKKQVSL